MLRTTIARARLSSQLSPLPRALGASSIRAYSRSRRSLDDGNGGWYGQPLRATTILSVRKDNKVVRAFKKNQDATSMCLFYFIS